MAAPNHTQILVKAMTTNVLATIQLFHFDFEYHEKNSKLVFNGSTFLKPNPKAFELIVHFLLTKIDPERANKAFSQCWPPILKEQMKECKDTMFNWLVELTSPKQQKENNANSKFHALLCHIKFPSITKSLLTSPGGLKTCELLSSMSQYAILLNLLKLGIFNQSACLIFQFKPK